MIEKKKVKSIINKIVIKYKNSGNPIILEEFVDDIINEVEKQ